VLAAVGGSVVSQVVPVGGAAKAPEITFAPAVAHEGRVTFVSGEFFLPGVPLQLEWSRGPVAVPLVIPDASGSFTVPTVVIKGPGAGPRTLTVTMPLVSQPVEASPLMVVVGSAQPPDFLTRN
jgi:hypothetical protein